MTSPSSPAVVAKFSTTSIPKATYVPLTLSSRLTVDAAGAATQLFSFARSLNLQPEDVAAVQSALSVALPAATAQIGVAENLFTLLKQFEGSPLPGRLPPASAFASIPVADFVSFGNALASVRAKRLADLSSDDPTVGTATNLLNTALNATAALADSGALPPIGMLNLERLEMTPAGVQRGALLATVPLAPQERTSVVQQEWSVTDQEFTSIVTDSLENYSATGVTENTQLTQATSSQVSHNNQFNVNATVSGGIGFVSGSASTSFGSQDANSQSAQDSRNHALQTTKQASTRVTQSHKTSFSISTTTGESESSTRVLFNPSDSNAMRVDYFSIMRQWYVALYRYGLRLTYDITIPEPGAAMRETYAQLDELQKQASQGFTLPLKYSDISPQTYNDPASALWFYTNKYGAQIQAPPDGSLPGQPLLVPVPSQTVPTTSDPSKNYEIATLSVPFTIRDGQQIDHIDINYNVGENHAQWVFHILGYDASGSSLEFSEANCPVHGGGSYYEWNVPNQPLDNFMKGATGSVAITVQSQYANPLIVSFNVYTVATEDSVQNWQASVYSTVYNAAQTAFYAQQQLVDAQIQTLQNQINNVDTLTLRREEHDEIMKCVLRWLLGDQVDVFMPASVVSLFAAQPGADLQYGVDFTGSNTDLTISGWSLVDAYEQQVNFINQAIDWDNITYFLYSYFWDVPASWDFIRQIQHPDSTRQAFLRAGAARVVLTVQKGWETAWTYFVLTGKVPPTNDPAYAHPYMTIAQQIADYDSTNYPGIPPADPTNTMPVDYDDIQPVGTTCDQDLTASAAPVTITVADSTGFVVGATAIIDNFVAVPAANVQEAQTITAVPDGTHITVQALSYDHSPANNDNEPFPVVQAGSKGTLIAEWFEYTPTSGTDIAINSDLSTVS